jgi:transposase-like protein
LNIAPIGVLDSAVIKHRTNLVGIFLNDAAVVRLVGSQLQEQQEE